jgi:hypothetical protein
VNLKLSDFGKICPAASGALVSNRALATSCGVLCFFESAASRVSERVHFLRRPLRPLPSRGQIRPKARSYRKRFPVCAAARGDLSVACRGEKARPSFRQLRGSGARRVSTDTLERLDSYSEAVGRRMENPRGGVERHTNGNMRPGVRFRGPDSLSSVRAARRFVPTGAAGVAGTVRSLICWAESRPESCNTLLTIGGMRSAIMRRHG